MEALSAAISKYAKIFYPFIFGLACFDIKASRYQNKKFHAWKYGYPVTGVQATIIKFIIQHLQINNGKYFQKWNTYNINI